MADERSLFFNGNWWRQFLGNNQAVRYLEELWRRAGGAQPPDLSLDQVVNQITSIDQSVTGMGASLHQVRQMVTQIVSEHAAEKHKWAAAMKKLEHRINQLEDAQ